MLMIKKDVDLSALEKYGFKYEEIKEKTWHALYVDRNDDCYTEKKYVYDDGITTFEVVQERKNSDWKHSNVERELWITSNDDDLGISRSATETLFDMITDGIVEKVEDD